jgi:hypothetical protein
MVLADALTRGVTTEQEPPRPPYKLDESGFNQSSILDTASSEQLQ